MTDGDAPQQQTSPDGASASQQRQHVGNYDNGHQLENRGARQRRPNSHRYQTLHFRYELIVMDREYLAMWDRTQQLVTDLFIDNIALRELAQELRARSCYWTCTRERLFQAAARQLLLDWFTRIIRQLARVVLRGDAYERLEDLVQASVDRGHMELANEFQRHFRHAPRWQPPVREAFSFPLPEGPLEFHHTTMDDVERQILREAVQREEQDGRQQQRHHRIRHDSSDDDDDDDIDDEELANIPGLGTYQLDLNIANDQDDTSRASQPIEAIRGTRATRESSEETVIGDADDYGGDEDGDAEDEDGDKDDAKDDDIASLSGDTVMGDADD
ncbi:hypothetical protein SCUCBS95973_009940 [Sporothrix curviconia]|uniref:Uncharacterized protein n=1 Tax=Sporothrix curviconia TaxID=1260050 RepID=A0ABP0CZ05_9PEZI